ncbi:MAG TPA: DUF547 domain-containing protein [Tepidisphaeraceae bacterium]|jgi:hypothetical protein
MRQKALLAIWLLGVGAALGFVLSGCVGGGGPVSKEYAPRSRLAKWDNADWQRVLDQTVSPDGLVKYDALTGNTNGAKDALFRYVGQINQASPENRPDLFPNETDKLAYYLNAYNALCMYGVLQKGLPANVALSGLFYTVSFPVGGKPMNLDTLEKRYVRSAGDPRVHFALNCMSKSCPPLRNQPYEGPKLDEQLADQGRRFLNDPRGVQSVSERKVRLSEIFTKFYPGDFKDAYAHQSGKRDPGLLESIRPFGRPDSPVQTATEYESMPYDWSLNRAP